MIMNENLDSFDRRRWTGPGTTESLGERVEQLEHAAE